MTYRTTTIDELYNAQSEPTLDLYVYSIENNPNGAGRGTAAELIGTADTYTVAADLWDAACATAEALGVGYKSIGLCIHEDAVQDVPSLCGHDDEQDYIMSNADFAKSYGVSDPILSDLHVGGY